MIYLLYGTDTNKSRIKLHELIGSLIKKRPDASHVKVNDETFNAASLDEYIGGMGLFAQKMIVEMDNVFRNKDAKEEVISRLKDIKASDNIFVFLEGELLKGEVTKFEKQAEKIQEFTESVKTVSLKEGMGEKTKFNIFSLTDALGKRDRKQLWVLYQKAIMNGSVAEEIHGILFWQIKAMLQTAQAENPKDAGLNPYVYQKSGGFLKNYTEQEVKTMASKLVELYHQARRGISDMSVSLERFVLEI
jgi:DNA polymerase III delta subunit